jgi:microcystin-dependent protein
MSDPFVAEIRIFPFNFAPKGWAFCDGQLLPISQNTALFSLLGTTYGGDGKSTFALPDMQGNAAMQPGQGQGLSLRDLGEMSGVESITLLQSEMPSHNHILNTSNNDGNNTQPAGRYTGRGNAIYGPIANTNLMGLQTIGVAGGGLPHNNMQPYLTLNYCIALQGVFPQRP